MNKTTKNYVIKKIKNLFDLFFINLYLRYTEDEWFFRLVKWAKQHNISKDKFPRNKEKLLAVKKLDLTCKKLTNIPPEIGNLTNLRRLYLYKNNIKKLPEIGNLVNLYIAGLDETGLFAASINVEIFQNVILTSPSPLVAVKTI